MNFQDLQVIEDHEQLLDQAFRQAAKKAKAQRGSIRGDRMHKAKRVAISRIETVQKTLVKKVTTILTSFPSIFQLPVFYQELLKLDADIGEVKMDLGSLNWATKKIPEFSGKYKALVHKAQLLDKVESHWKAYYGRISSVMRELKGPLKRLEALRRTMKGYPAIKTSLFTVAIAGFPNVGKSTLLKRLTKANPKIQSYAFTTTSLNLGYALMGGKKVQFVDTPGTLARFAKMNRIEQRAYLAMKYCADAFIYVLDPIETYPWKDQVKLLKSVKQYKRPVVLYLSKTDMVPVGQFPEGVGKLKPFKAVEDVQDAVKQLAAED